MDPTCNLNLKENRDKLNQEICNENLTTDEEIDIIERFEISQYLCCKILACCCCGIKTPQRGKPNSFYKEINLDQLSILQ